MSSDAICENLGQVSDIAIEIVFFHHSTRGLLHRDDGVGRVRRSAA